MGQKSFACVSMTFYEKFMTQNGSHTSKFFTVWGPDGWERKYYLQYAWKKMPIGKFYEILMNNN